MYNNSNVFTQQQNQLLQQMLAGSSSAEQHVTKVNGRPGAETFQLAPNSDTLLLDSSAPIVWLVQTDGAGYKTLTPYDIAPHVEVKQEDIIKKLEERIDKLEGIINAKSNTSSSRSGKSEQYNASSISSDDAR